MSDSKLYKIGVIGVGVWGCHSLERELMHTGKCQIKSICGNDDFGAGLYDDVISASKKYASEFNANFVTDPDAIINDTEIDIISVMTSPAVKAKWIIKALQNNKYVVIDKPLSLTLKEAKTVCEAEVKSNAHGFMLSGYHTRPAVAKLIEIIKSGKLGEVKAVSIRLNFTGGIYPGFHPTNKWSSDIPGGESVTIGSHALITALKLINSTIKDSFQIRKNNFYEEYKSVGADDYALYNLKFNNGAVANISVGRLPYKISNEDIIIEVTGTDGYANITGTKLQTYPDNKIYDGSFNAEDISIKIFNQFLESITNKNIKPATTFNDGLEIQKVFELNKGINRELI